MLVLFNMGRIPAEEYGLTLAGSSLDSDLSVKLLFGEGELTTPEVNGDGGFENYKPLKSVPPQSSYVIQLATP
jgi:hypothetical protein